MGTARTTLKTTLFENGGSTPVFVYTAEIVLGSPGLTGCTGNGICRMFPVDKATIIPLAVQAHLCRDMEGRLTLQIKAADLSAAQVLQHFQGAFFKVTHAFIFPKWLRARCGSQLPLPEKIEPGLYPIERNRYGYRILLISPSSN